MNKRFIKTGKMVNNYLFQDSKTKIWIYEDLQNIK